MCRVSAEKIAVLRQPKAGSSTTGIPASGTGAASSSATASSAPIATAAVPVEDMQTLAQRVRISTQAAVLKHMESKPPLERLVFMRDTHRNLTRAREGLAARPAQSALATSEKELNRFVRQHLPAALALISKNFKQEILDTWAKEPLDALTAKVEQLLKSADLATELVHLLPLPPDARQKTAMKTDEEFHAAWRIEVFDAKRELRNFLSRQIAAKTNLNPAITAASFEPLFEVMKDVSFPGGPAATRRNFDETMHMANDVRTELTRVRSNIETALEELEQLRHFLTPGEVHGVLSKLHLEKMFMAFQTATLLGAQLQMHQPQLPPWWALVPAYVDRLDDALSSFEKAVSVYGQKMPDAVKCLATAAIRVEAQTTSDVVARVLAMHLMFHPQSVPPLMTVPAELLTALKDTVATLICECETLEATLQSGPPALAPPARPEPEPAVEVQPPPSTAAAASPRPGKKKKNKSFQPSASAQPLRSTSQSVPETSNDAIVAIPDLQSTLAFGQLQSDGTVITAEQKVYEPYNGSYLPIDPDASLTTASGKENTVQTTAGWQSQAQRSLERDYAKAEGELHKQLAGHGPNSRAVPIKTHVDTWTRKLSSMRALAAKLEAADEPTTARKLRRRCSAIEKSLVPLQDVSTQRQRYVDEVLSLWKTPVASHWINLIQMGQAKAQPPRLKPEDNGNTLVIVKLNVVPGASNETGDIGPELHVHYTGPLDDPQDFVLGKAGKKHLKNAEQARLNGDGIYRFDVAQDSLQALWMASMKAHKALRVPGVVNAFAAS